MRAQEEHEGLIAVRDRLESGRVFVEEQLAKTKVGGGGRVYGVNIPSILASGVIFLVHLHYNVFAKTKVGGVGGCMVFSSYLFRRLASPVGSPRLHPSVHFVCNCWSNFSAYCHTHSGSCTPRDGA